ncbi:DNA-directed DNA polymerase II small subunit [Candidatus Woesearchaeota archaeon]|nr:DNA-directed DNA polymerase II small subunit [Candidatus Woesearchaeota archaeon]
MSDLQEDVKKKFISLLIARGILLSKQTNSLLTPEKIKKGAEILESAEISSEQELLAMLNNQPTTLNLSSSIKPTIKIVKSYPRATKKVEVSDFVQHFNSRYRVLSSFIQHRHEISNITSIQRIKQKTDRETVSIIGILKEKQITKNNNVVLTLEDVTGEIKVLVSKNNPELNKQSRDIVEDEVIGVSGTAGQDMIYANTIIWPDIPFNKEIKKADDETYAIFLSDLHVGSKNFLEENFLKFIKWIRGEIGNESQIALTKKIKYAFFIGDMVDGVGVYPDQESELVINDIYKQYEVCAEYLKMIPEDITLIICPGNHDAQRISEPQPPLPEDIAAPLYSLKNALLVSNPSLINIHSSNTFPGFDVLMYHGYSFDHYIASVDSLRAGGGYNKIDNLMKFLLKRRHLAPTHDSTLYFPSQDDNLLIDKIPDFFVTGHIHKTAVSSYRNITLICGSCWQSKTSFQEKVGHDPEPARVPIVNLKTREIKVLRF